MCSGFCHAGEDMRLATFSVLLAATTLSFGMGPVFAGETFEAIKAKGFVQCGVNLNAFGFSAPDTKGQWSGIDVDLCHAIAATMFGDASKVRFTPLSSAQRFTALQSGEVDVLTRSDTQTFLRGTTLGLALVGVSFYDGQGVMVPKASGIKSIKSLNGATICMKQGTTTEANVADYFNANHMSFKPLVIDGVQANEAFFSGRCDAVSDAASALAGARSEPGRNPEDYVILPELLTKEPLGPYVRRGDTEWHDLVQFTLDAMIEAEEKGITRKNVDEMRSSPSLEIQRMLGLTPGFGKALGVDDRWVYTVIKQVGNYGEIFERNLGHSSPLQLDRGINDLWTRGGLMYAIPMR